MDGGGEVNTGGWLPPPGPFGCVCVCAQKKQEQNKWINNDWTLHGKPGHHTLNFIKYLGPTNLVHM